MKIGERNTDSRNKQLIAFTNHLLEIIEKKKKKEPLSRKGWGDLMDKNGQCISISVKKYCSLL